MVEPTLTVSLVVNMFLNLLGGLGLFLLGMKNMSEGMQAVAGNKLRQMIKAVTSNRLSACGIGTGVTALVQSSSVTTVMVVGFVNAGFMTLKQAVGVIMGSNIGTTATAWIIAGLPIGKYGLPILGIAALFYLFSRNDKLRFTAMTIMGVGMVFFGLELMSQGMKPMRSLPEFRQWFSMFDATTGGLGVFKCVLAGALLTALVQSSSATVGLTMTLAVNNVINFETAAALVLGENIGTTITAMLASIGATTNGKRAAYSHTIFNVVGVVWITLLFAPYLTLVRSLLFTAPEVAVAVENGAEAAGETIYPHMKTGIALVHSLFNIANTIMFLPFVGFLTLLVTRMVPEKKHKESPHLAYLDVRMLHSPAIGIQQSSQEVSRMAGHVHKMFGMLEELTATEKQDPALMKKFFHREEVLDIVQKEVTEFLSNLLSGNISHEVSDEARQQLRMADEYESISDYLTTVMKLHLKSQANGIPITTQSAKDLAEIQTRTRSFFGMVTEAVASGNRDILSKARTEGAALSHLIKRHRSAHMDTVGTTSVSPLKSLVFNDILQSYGKIKDHAINAAEAFVGDK